MRGLVTLTAIVALVFAFGGVAVADEEQGHDFALFNANGDDLADDEDTSGALCSVTNEDQDALVVAPWRWYVSISNPTAGPLSALVRYVDGDSVSYPIPAGTSFAFTTAAGGGSIAFADIALRLVAEEGLSGSVSARGPKDDDDGTVFCISCDETAPGDFDGDAACDFIIAD